MNRFRTRAVAVAAGLALASGLVSGVPATANTDAPYVLPQPPELAAIAPLPYTGIKVASFATPSNMTELTTTPSRGFVNSNYTVGGSKLSPNTSYTLVWNTSEAAWKADVDPTTANYRGTQYSKINVSMGTVTTDANGSFTFPTKIPMDFGGAHDIYLVKDGTAVAKGGYQIDRTVTISPKSGPVGTPITVTYTGLGASLYTAGGSINYDNKYAGQVLALWTRGTGKAVIRASGAPGDHYIQVADAITFMYMNILQSPVPQANGDTVKFRVTKDAGLIKPYATWPMKVNPTISARTTLTTAGLDPDSKAAMTLTPATGPVLSKTRLKVTGLPADGPVNLQFSTVVGSRVDCPPGSTQCWKFNPIQMGTANVSGGAIDQDIIIPDNLGGYHVVQVVKNGKIQAQAPFYVHASIVEFRDSKGKLITAGVAKADTRPEKLPAGAGAPTYTFKQGEAFTISVKGVGWTQFDNTMGVTYDNSYIGYGCGFNSNGYMVIHLVATGEPGTHIIDLWPNLYTWQPSFTNTHYGMAPLLSAGWDSPALALGYRVPSLHFSIKVVK